MSRSSLPTACVICCSTSSSGVGSSSTRALALAGIVVCLAIRRAREKTEVPRFVTQCNGQQECKVPRATAMVDGKENDAGHDAPTNQPEQEEVTVSAARLSRRRDGMRRARAVP